MDGKWRQKLHLEPPKGWLNDPNGLCYYNGFYHVYFQYAPQSAYGSSPKCWGHYKSKNLTDWEFTGTVLSPGIPEDNDGVYSGSAIVKDGKMHIFYTGNVKEKGNYDYILNGRGSNVIHVISEDGHNMGNKHVVLKNSDYPPFCTCHVRDPQIWHEDGIYHMVLGARTKENQGCLLFYTSKDLGSWNFDRHYLLENLGYMWECPGCFTINGRQYINISPQGLKHETYKNQNVYSSGYLLNEIFTEWDYGFDFYAPQIFTAPDGRHIITGWMGISDADYKNPTAELGWQHCLTTLREITALEDGTLMQAPVKEYNKLRHNHSYITDGMPVKLTLPFDLEADISGSFEINIEKNLVLALDNGIFSVKFNGNIPGYGRKTRCAKVDGCKNIRIIADMSSLEIYLADGRYVFSTRFYPDSNNITIKLNGIHADIYQMHGMEININGK